MKMMPNAFTLFAVYIAVTGFGLYAEEKPGSSSQCSITWEQFEEFVAGYFWLNPYMVDFRVDKSIFFGRPRNLLTLLPNDTVLDRSNHWNSVHGGCDTHLAVMEKSDPVKAKLEYIQPFFELHYQYMSQDPSRYLINRVCFGPLDDGVCLNPFVLIMFRDQRNDTDGDGVPDGEIILENIPWCEVEATLKKCVGKTFTDEEEPRVEWIWEGLDNCPFPPGPTTTYR